MRQSVLLLSLCVAIVGCDKAEDGADAEIGAYSLFDPAAVNPSLCAAPAIPFPNNALFAQGTGVTTDTTLNIPSSSSTAAAANLTDGWSTTASAFTDVLGSVDLDSAANAIIVLEADASPRVLVHGVDYELQTSTAMAQVSGTGGCALNATVNTGRARFLPVNQQRTRILIEPKKPLNPSTTYIIVVTNDLLSSDGVPTRTNEFFPLVNSSTAICDRAASDPNLIDCSDPAAPADAAARLNAPALATMTAIMPNPAGAPPTIGGAAAAAVRLTTLETLRANLVRPTILGFHQLRTALTLPAIADEDIVIGWSFTTQSIGASFAVLNQIAAPKNFTVTNSGLSTGDLDLNGDGNPGDLIDSANIWLGTFDLVPYYLDNASGVNDAASQTGFWLNNGTVTCNSTATCLPVGGFVPFTPVADYDGDGTAPPSTPATPAPCTTGVAPFNWVAPLSTTNCFRIPLERSQEDLPVMITVPMSAKPLGGWPVVIFQHGITGNRTQMLPIGAAYAALGMVTVAIDLPLHGVMPGASFYQMGNERTFDLDISSNASGACLSAPGGEMPPATDASGTCFINLGSLITSRDNLRQAVADLLHLSRSLGATGLDFDGNAGNDIDTARIHFSGLSLGSIVGTTLLGVDSGGTVKASSLNVPGGGLGKLLDASASFGPRIAVGLAGGALLPAPNGQSGVNSPYEGTDTYETFVRFAQHLTDPGDPINYAVAANATHRIHMTMVDDDTVVPNNANSTCPDPETFPLGIGETALTDNSNPNTRIAACEAGAELVGADPNMLQLTACAGAATVGICAGNAAQDETLITGFLSGTVPLYTQMGLALTGPITPPGTAANQTNANGIDTVVRFAAGAHSSLLSPAGGAAVTCEMQRQTAAYLFSNGTSLPVGGTCP